MCLIPIKKQRSEIMLSENELLLLIDIAKDQYSDEIEELRRMNSGKIDENAEISFIIRKNILPKISVFLSTFTDRSYDEMPNLSSYEDLISEDIKEIRKKYKTFYSEKEKSRKVPKDIWEKLKYLFVEEDEEYTNYIINQFK